MRSLDRLTLAHLWTAFIVFFFACLLGVWQMLARSPLSVPFFTPSNYFLSVTAHGTAMAYVLTTFFIMGFGYFTAERTLNQPLPLLRAAWAAFYVALAGTLLAVATVMSGRASVRPILFRAAIKRRKEAEPLKFALIATFACR